MPSGTSDATPEGERLAAARGNLRDALGSVKNLLRGLQSVRVGPRSIEGVLPEVGDSGAAIEANIRIVLEAVAKRLPGGRAAVDELLDWIAPRTRELERTLVGASGKPVNAKARLALEQSVARLCLELEVGRALVDLLDDAVSGSHVALELSDFLRNAAMSHGDGAQIKVGIEPGLSGEVSVNPRVCGLVLGIGASLVHRHTQSTPIVRRGSDSCLVIEVGDSLAEIVSLPTLPLVEPTLACARAAADGCSARLEWDESIPRVSLLMSA